MGRLYPRFGARRGLGVLLALGCVESAGRAQSFFDPFSDAGAATPFPAFPTNGFNELPGTDGNAGDNFLIQQGMPYNPVVARGGLRRYRMKFGRATGNIGTGVSMTYTDNGNLVGAGSGASAQGDFAVATSLSIGLSMPLDRENSLQLNVGLGYAHHFNRNIPDQITISPASAWDYQTTLGPVRLTIYDRIATPGSAGPSPQISGTGSLTAVNFHRFNNDAGFSAALPQGKSTTLSMGYSLNTDVGMGDAFSQQDHLTHSVTLAVFERLNRRWTVGFSSSAYLNQFFQRFQNDSKGYGLGPTLTWQPNRRFNVSASTRYSVGYSQATGVVADTHGFAGVTYDLSIENYLSRQISHGISGGSHVDLGIGSNFAETLGANYHLSWRVTNKIPLTLMALYTDTAQTGIGYDFRPIPDRALFVSGATPQLLTANGLIPLPTGTLLTPSGLLAEPRAAERSRMVNLSWSTSYQFTDNLSAGMSYSHGIRLSNLTGHGYSVNTVTLSLSYQF
jgi:hypothetical protein